MGSTHASSNEPNSNQIQGESLPPVLKQKLNTPVKIHELTNYLDGYNVELRNYLVEGFTEGFSLEFKGERNMGETRNLKSAVMNPKVTEDKINKELKLGRIAGPFKSPPLKDLTISPIGLHPKKAPGEFRLITH